MTGGRRRPPRRRPTAPAGPMGRGRPDRAGRSPRCRGALGLALAGGAAVLGTALSGAWSRRIQTTTQVIDLPHLPTSFDGFRILQISDLHATRFGPGQRDLLAAVEHARADLVVLTGDALDRGTRDVGPLLELAGELVRGAPVHAITGNHEGGSRRGPALMAGLRARGVEVLGDRSVLLERDGDAVRVAGIDDPRVHGGPASSQVSPAIDHRLAAGGLRRAGLARRGAVPGTPLAEHGDREALVTVLLAHRPELLDVYAAHEVDVVLSGHAHGGQWRVPGIGGLYAPNQGILPRLTAGVHTRGRTRMVISRGLKVRWHLPRIANRPELVLVELRRR